MLAATNDYEKVMHKCLLFKDDQKLLNHEIFLLNKYVAVHALQLLDGS